MICLACHTTRPNVSPGICLTSQTHVSSEIQKTITDLNCYFQREKVFFTLINKYSSYLTLKLLFAKVDRKNEKNKEAFFLRHTACLPSSTSQLVLFHHLFCIHFWGGPLLCSLLGGSTSMFTSRGDPLPCSILGGPLLCTLLGGFPCYPSHNALIYCYRMPQCITERSHGTPPPELDRQTDKHD